MAVNDDYSDLIEKAFENGISVSTPIDPSSVQITQRHHDFFHEVAIELDKGFIKKCGLNKNFKFNLNEQEIHLESGIFEPDETKLPKQYKTSTFVGVEDSEIEEAKKSIHMAIVSLNAIFNEIPKKTDSTNITIYKRFTFVSVDKMNESGKTVFLIHYGIIHS